MTSQISKILKNQEIFKKGKKLITQESTRH